MYILPFKFFCFDISGSRITQAFADDVYTLFSLPYWFQITQNGYLGQIVFQQLDISLYLIVHISLSVSFIFYISINFKFLLLCYYSQWTIFKQPFFLFVICLEWPTFDERIQSQCTWIILMYWNKLRYEFTNSTRLWLKVNMTRALSI